MQISVRLIYIISCQSSARGTNNVIAASYEFVFVLDTKRYKKHMTHSFPVSVSFFPVLYVAVLLFIQLTATIKTVVLQEIEGIIIIERPADQISLDFITVVLL